MVSYDAWKTRSPDDERHEDEEYHQCLHDHIRWSMWTGRPTCRDCGGAEEDWEPLTIPERVRHVWNELRWWVKCRYWQRWRPIKAWRSWRLGYRPAPWKPDDQIPF